MRILILFSHAWRGGRSGGAETHALQLIKKFAERGHELFFVASSGRNDMAELPPGAVRQWRLPFQSLNPLDKITSFRRLVQIVESEKIELVHAHHRTGGYFAECLYRRTGVPYVVTVHDIWHRAPFKSSHGRIFRNLIAVSGFIKRGLVERFGFDPERIRVVHNGVEPERFEKVREEDVLAFREQFDLRPEVVHFSLVARVTRSKGHYDVLEALRLVPQDLPCRVLVVGEGRDLPKLKKLAQRYGIEEKITFCGFRRNVPAVMRASDVVLLPSHREPFALTLVETMFAGRPLLVSDSGGTPEAVTHEGEGLVFPTRNVAALARGLERMTRDAALRERLAEQARRTAYERFTLDGIIDQTEAVYREVVGAAGKVGN